MLDSTTTELISFLIGTVAIGAIYVPWQARIFQNRQREIGVRTSLVKDMSQCVMAFDVKLRRSAEFVEADKDQPTANWLEANPDAKLDANPRSLAEATLAFDVARCVVGTELEAYFTTSGRPTIASEWDHFTNLFITFAELTVVGNMDAYSSLIEQLEGLPLTKRDWSDAESAANPSNFDPSWIKVEQLLLAEKIRLIRCVLRLEMPRMSR